jgi:hypothetical protein
LTSPSADADEAPNAVKQSNAAVAAVARKFIMKVARQKLVEMPVSVAQRLPRRQRPDVANGFI